MGLKIVSWSNNLVKAGQRLIFERPISCIYKDGSPKGMLRSNDLNDLRKIPGVTKDCYVQISPMYNQCDRQNRQNSKLPFILRQT